ncbi:MAG: hypothetical protein JXA92_13155 [candidate division Zixibacteria bacterium]|nr:hypothetical protein [candidate division Zixibacteria bacterium]
MSNRIRKIPGLDPVRDFPYYKIQIWQDNIGAWKDNQQKFSSLSELHLYALEQLDSLARTRIVKVEGCGNCRIDEDFDAFGEPR